MLNILYWWNQYWLLYLSVIFFYSNVIWSKLGFVELQYTFPVFTFNCSQLFHVLYILYFTWNCINILVFLRINRSLPFLNADTVTKFDHPEEETSRVRVRVLRWCHLALFCWQESTSECLFVCNDWYNFAGPEVFRITAETNFTKSEHCNQVIGNILDVLRRRILFWNLIKLLIGIHNWGHAKV